MAETPDDTSTGDPSNLVDLTPAAVSPTGVGIEIGLTGIEFGTEAGSAYDKNLRFTAFSIASDDRTTSYNGQTYPATALFTINPSTGAASGPLSIAGGRYLDGLAVGGDGTLFASDCRLTDSLYKYNFDTNTWVLVGAFGVSLNEDSGLANYYGVGGSETNFYLVTEGDGALFGRLWTVNATTGALSAVNSPAGNNNLTLADGTEVPEDLEGFEIPWSTLAGE